MKFEEIFNSSKIRTVPTESKDEYRSIHEITLEIEPLEGSSLYNTIPGVIDGEKTIYGFVYDSDIIRSMFAPEAEDDLYKSRYIIMRERDHEFVTLFVNGCETKMHYLKSPKAEVLSVLNASRHPTPEV